MRGSKPATWQERRKIEASGHEPVVPRIQFSSASSSSLSPRLRGQRVALGQRDVHRVVEQVQALDAVLGQRPVGDGDVERDVDLAAAQPAQRRPRLGGLERQLDRRVALAEARDRLGHDRRAGAGEGGQAQAPAAQAGDRLELGLGVGEAGEDRVGVLDQRATGVGQAHAARVALDERRAGLALEGGDLLGDRGLRVGQRVGGGGEGAARGDLAQHAHSADIEH